MVRKKVLIRLVSIALMTLLILSSKDLARVGPLPGAAALKAPV